MSSACCESDADLLIVGGGSAAFAAALKAHELGARVTLVNDGLPIGGTCVNVGCVPSKTLIRAAEAHHRAGSHAFDGIHSTSQVTDFASIINQKQALVDELRQAKYLDVVADLERFERVAGRARFADDHTIDVDGRILRADRILIATGSSPNVPAVPGLADSGCLTSQTAFELRELPESLIVLGGRYIALELAQLFTRFGSQVTVLQRSSRILPTEDEHLTDALTEYLQAEGVQIVTDVSLERVDREASGFTVEASVEGRPAVFSAEQLVAATGRQPNTQDLGLGQTGIALTAAGEVRVDEHLRTAAPDIYAAGDVIGEPAFVYTAAYEGALAAENALGNAARARDYTALPWVIFTDPQFAGVGLDQSQAADLGLETEAVTLSMAHVPRALAARDTRGYLTLIRESASDRLVGARVLAPEGGELLMELGLAIRHRIPVTALAQSFHPYLTQSEAVKLAALSFGKDINKLSCCAS